MVVYRALHMQSRGTPKLVTRNIVPRRLEVELTREILDAVASGFSDQMHFTVVSD